MIPKIIDIKIVPTCNLPTYIKIHINHNKFPFSEIKTEKTEDETIFITITGKK
jgi:hypothetical protein